MKIESKVSESSVTMDDWRVVGGQDHTPVVEIDAEKQFHNEQIQLYWLDATEDRFSNPGTVYLFGKVRSKFLFL